MSQRKNVSISLSAELHAVVERMLASGRYGNFSEVVRAALRLLDERELSYQAHKKTCSPAQLSPGADGSLKA